MHRLHILIAHELNAYASALAGVLSHVRPHFLVQHVRPAELEEEMARFPEALVVSDQVAEPDKRAGAGWILYYPSLQDVAIVRLGQAERTVAAPDLDDVLAALDEAERYQFATFGHSSGSLSDVLTSATNESSFQGIEP